MQESIHQAATILLVRDRLQQDSHLLEVYMTKRPETMRFLPSHYVFPGGSMDAEDAEARLFARCAPVPDDLNPEGLSLAYWVTAIREMFEEAGILLARNREGQPVRAEAFAEARAAMLKGEHTFLQVIEAADLQLSTDRLRYFGHRLTPRSVSKRRFDTRYFLTLLPTGEVPSPHVGEVAEEAWLDAQTALSRFEKGEMQMVPPTVDCLRVLGEFRTTDEIWNSAKGVGDPTPFELA